MAINELCQAGVLQTANFEVLDQSGPSHQPMFSVIASATTSDGTTMHTEAVHAPTKKAAQRQAAERLLDLLVAAGLSRR
jgi:dsRNA-specific ribonuclease